MTNPEQLFPFFGCQSHSETDPLLPSVKIGDTASNDLTYYHMKGPGYGKVIFTLEEAKTVNIVARPRYDGIQKAGLRILDDNGVVCIIYNVRVYDEFSKKQCEISEKYCEEFESLTHGYDKTANLMESFFSGNYVTYEYDFPLEYTKKKFILRCLSSSYAPLPDSNNYDSYVCELNTWLDETFKDDMFKIANKTVMFVGKVN